MHMKKLFIDMRSYFMTECNDNILMMPLKTSIGQIITRVLT